MGKGGYSFNDNPVGMLGGDGAGAVVGRGDLHDVHGDEVDSGDNVPDGAEELTGSHSTGLWGAGAGSEAGVKDIYIDGEVYELGAVQGLIYGLIHDDIEAALIELGHQMPAHPLLFHPLPDLGWRPVASEADLDEIPGENGATFDESTHGAAVGDEAATKAVGSGVCVGVEMDDANLATAPGVGDCCGCREGYGVVTPEYNGEAVGGEGVGDLLIDGCMGQLEGVGWTVCITEVHDIKDGEGLNLE